MSVPHLIFLLSFQSIFGLQSKLFGKHLIDPSSILAEEVQQIKESSVPMDKITCSTFCLRESDNCNAFYFKDNACMIIKDATGMVKTTVTNTQAMTVFINEDPKEEIGSLFQGHILVHPDQWTSYIYKSEPSTNYENCGFSCELTADFFALHSGTCYCGLLGHSGSTLDLGQAEITIHIKIEAADKLMNEKWMKVEDMDQWHQWIFEIHQQDEKTGHRECLFRGMYHKECDFVKYHYVTRKCFLGSFYYTGEPKIDTMDTSNMDTLVYLKKDDSCPDGWTLIGRTCYIVSDEKLDFFEGKDKCIEQDAKLIEPKNLEENENIATLVKQKHGNEARYFIGLRDKQEDSKFVYESTGQEPIFLHWHEGQQPNDKNFGKVHIENDNFWHEGAWANPDYIVCQKEPTKWDFGKIDFKPSKDHLATSFPVFGPNYKIELKLTFLEFKNVYKNILNINLGPIAIVAGTNEAKGILNLGTNGDKLVTKAENVGQSKITIQQNKPYQIIISQALKDTKWMFEVQVQDEVVFSQENDNPKMFIDAKLYLSNPTAPEANEVQVEYLLVNRGQGYTHPGYEKHDFSPTQNHLATTFAKYGPEFKYHLVLLTNEVLPSNIFRLRTSDPNQVSGSRYPSLFFDSFNKLVIGCELNGDSNPVIHVYENIETQTKYEIVIEQFSKDGKIMFEVKVNEDEMTSVENTLPLTLLNAKLYLADQWFSVSDLRLDYFLVTQGLVNQSPYFQKTDFKPKFSTLEAGFPIYGPIFRFHIKLTVNALPDEVDWQSIFRLKNEDGENDFEENFSKRYPALYLSKSGWFGFYLDAIQGGLRYEGIELEKPYEITIEQSLKQAKLIYEITVNQDIVVSIENTQPEMFTNAKLYLSDKYFQEADVSIEYFKLYLGQASNQDHFIRNNFISMVGDTRQPNSIMSSEFWPSHIYNLTKFQETELKCAQICYLGTKCHFYYYANLMPEEDNICYLGAFDQREFQSYQFNGITDTTEYKLKANLDLEALITDVFDTDTSNACLNQGYHQLSNGIEVEIGTGSSYSYRTADLCKWSFYAPDAVGITYEITKFDTNDQDDVEIIVSPMEDGHNELLIGGRLDPFTKEIWSRYLRVDWFVFRFDGTPYDSYVSGGWRIKIHPFYS